MKTRVITAIVGLPLLLLLLLAAPKLITFIVAGLVAAIAAYELLAGTGMVKSARLCLYSMMSAFWCVFWCGLGIGYAWLLLGVFVLWILLFAEMMASGLKLSFDKTALCFAAGVLMPLMLGSLVRIFAGPNGRILVLIPFVVAFMSDSGAYFAGLYLGKRKLAPTISPKKTVEGVIGGVFGAVAGMLLFCLIINVFFRYEVNYLYAILYGVIGSATAVFGDLCFSVIKRQTGIKDFGNLFPGHGGVLDRLDSVMLVAPLTEILLMLLPVVM